MGNGKENLGEKILMLKCFMTRVLMNGGELQIIKHNKKNTYKNIKCKINKNEINIYNENNNIILTQTVKKLNVFEFDSGDTLVIVHKKDAIILKNIA